MSKKNILIGLLIIGVFAGFVKRDFLMQQGSRLLFGAVRYNEQTLRIVTNTPATDMAPTALDADNLIRISNIYEGLVEYDKNLKVVPALAVSWGNLNPTTWEFRLRKGVLFQDHSPFTADSVKESFALATTKNSEDMQSVVGTIKAINATGPNTLQIITSGPDPLLLSKLTRFHVSRPGNIGTGPYKLKELRTDGSVLLTAFTDYWGKKPAYRNVEYAVSASRVERENDFNAGKTDILVAVPRDQALGLPKDELKTSYSLEVNFLMFKMDDPLLKDRSIREAIAGLFDPNKIIAIGNQFVRQASQFVAPGVFGYNADIPAFQYSEDKRAKNLFGNRVEKIDLDFLDSYKTLSDYMQQQLRDAGFSVNSHALAPGALLERIKNNESPLFLIGWQAENGDAGGFLDAFVHSQGEFNKGRFSDAALDKLIEASRQEMDPAKRLKELQDILKKVNESLIGVPLFESSRLYAVRKGISWEPRLDGMVLASEVE